MTREHSPNPGATWETRLAAVEHVAPDREPPKPRPNRATRRAAARANRQKGQRR